MEYEIRLANESDKINLSKMIHEIYAKELGQYDTNDSNIIIDKYDENNNYIVAYHGDVLVGMVSITKPNTGKISTLSRIPLNHPTYSFKNEIAEIRLLSIKKEYRGKGLYKHIAFKVMQFCDLYNIERVLISAIENKIELYELMGFRVLSKPVIEGNCNYVPMELIRSNFSNSTYYRVLDGLRVYDKRKNDLKVLCFSLTSLLRPSTLKLISKRK